MPARASARRHLQHRVALPLLCLAFASALAADGAIDSGQSTIVATFKQQHVPVDAGFKRFSGSIVYDAAHPAATVANLSVDMNSLDVGDDDSDAEVRKPAWFDSARFPQATFRSTAITPGAAGHFSAVGTLAIKGKAQNITVDVTVQRSGAATAFDGSFELSRKAFGIGDPTWEGALDDTVRVRFHLLSAGA
jgi:polyisoprenoid-binding protein YceI